VTPARVVRPIPLYDDHGQLVRVVKPGARCFLVSEHETAATGLLGRRPLRAMVRFVDDFASGNDWDVDRTSIETAVQ
jgi:hypothetical protein